MSPKAHVPNVGSDIGRPAHCRARNAGGPPSKHARLGKSRSTVSSSDGVRGSRTYSEIHNLSLDMRSG